jgi:hydroxypyruvate reductase/glycerate 2-kinase
MTATFGSPVETGSSGPVCPPRSALRAHARSIWDAAVSAVRADDLVHRALIDPTLPCCQALAEEGNILVVGAGKAAAAMSAGVETALASQLERLRGFVNVPAELVKPLKAIHLHPARPAGTNHPTREGVAGTQHILGMLSQAKPQDLALCLFSGGGSALLPAPAEGLSLEDKQKVTFLLHACGATINEMNCVRKHMSQSKGGQLAQAFKGRALFSLIISDVVGDPLDVIASGPTAADPTTFADALEILEHYRLLEIVPPLVLKHLREGASGQRAETLKSLPPHIYNFILGNNARALSAAALEAERLGYPVLNLGSFIEGETRQVATVMAGLVRSIRAEGRPVSPPVCLLSGGETTVTLAANPGRGGRNQEFVLAAALKLGEAALDGVVLLSAGTDGEDGPTDAAGAFADRNTFTAARRLGLDPAAFLQGNDAYSFFDAVGDLLRTGLTQTNVMDVRVLLVL